MAMAPDRISTDVNTWLNVNGLGNKRLGIKGGGHAGLTVAPTADNWLAPNKPIRVTYDGLWWVADLYQRKEVDLWQPLKNPAR